MKNKKLIDIIIEPMKSYLYQKIENGKNNNICHFLSISVCGTMQVRKIYNK